MMAMHEAPVLAPAGLSFEDYLTAYEGVHAEWVDGQVHVMSPGNKRSSLLTRFLSSVIQRWAETHDLGETFVPPFGVHLDDTHVREPDVFFVRAEKLDRV
ncbi:MAG TPA: Uma2 family endonuclease, partial [Longimicrobium sp.]|nr:Uma2 family endonuclease [Longimicrobium sp.]